MHSFACGLAVSLAVALGGSAPRPLHPMETVMQDDAQLQHRSAREVRRSARLMAALGVDRVRLTASWSSLAPAREARRRPRFDATNSRQYPTEGFSRLDRAVREARAAGMKVMIDLAFFAPRWAVARDERSGRHAWRPSAREFGRFARAVAGRYNGRFPDPEGREDFLPPVRLWTTWNEPNHRVFLRPQWERVRGSWQPAAPHIYRRMHEAAYDQVKAVSHENRVLIGGLASFGNPGMGPRRGIAPLRFTRELACVDARLRPLRRRECRGFHALRADGFAHHPYSLLTPPGARDLTVDRVQIGELDRITNLLEALRRRGRIENPLPLYLTEYGYETKPPDPHGVPEETLGRYLGDATYLAWQRPEVRMFPQFLLRDIGPDLSKPVASAARWGDYQSGLFDHEGHPKPSVLRGFRLPFHAQVAPAPDGSQEVVAFGQVRPGRSRPVLEIQRLDPLRGWVSAVSVAGPPSPAAPTGASGGGVFSGDGEGYYLRRLAFQGAQSYRAAWHRPDGRIEHSLPVPVASPPPAPGG